MGSGGIGGVGGGAGSAGIGGDSSMSSLGSIGSNGLPIEASKNRRGGPSLDAPLRQPQRPGSARAALSAAGLAAAINGVTSMASSGGIVGIDGRVPADIAFQAMYGPGGPMSVDMSQSDLPQADLPFGAGGNAPGGGFVGTAGAAGGPMPSGRPGGGTMMMMQMLPAHARAQMGMGQHMQLPGQHRGLMRMNSNDALVGGYGQFAGAPSPTFGDGASGSGSGAAGVGGAAGGVGVGVAPGLAYGGSAVASIPPPPMLQSGVAAGGVGVGGVTVGGPAGGAGGAGAARAPMLLRSMSATGDGDVPTAPSQSSYATAMGAGGGGAGSVSGYGGDSRSVSTWPLDSRAGTGTATSAAAAAAALLPQQHQLPMAGVGLMRTDSVYQTDGSGRVLMQQPAGPAGAMQGDFAATLLQRSGSSDSLGTAASGGTDSAPGPGSRSVTYTGAGTPAPPAIATAAGLPPYDVHAMLLASAQGMAPAASPTASSTGGGVAGGGVSSVAPTGRGGAGMGDDGLTARMTAAEAYGYARSGAATVVNTSAGSGGNGSVAISVDTSGGSSSSGHGGNSIFSTGAGVGANGSVVAAHVQLQHQQLFQQQHQHQLAAAAAAGSVYARPGGYAHYNSLVAGGSAGSGGGGGGGVFTMGETSTPMALVSGATAASHAAAAHTAASRLGMPGGGGPMTHDPALLAGVAQPLASPGVSIPASVDDSGFIPTARSARGAGSGSGRGAQAALLQEQEAKHMAAVAALDAAQQLTGSAAQRVVAAGAVPGGMLHGRVVSSSPPAGAGASAGAVGATGVAPPPLIIGSLGDGSGSLGRGPMTMEIPSALHSVMPTARGAYLMQGAAAGAGQQQNFSSAAWLRSEASPAASMLGRNAAAFAAADAFVPEAEAARAAAAAAGARGPGVGGSAASTPAGAGSRGGGAAAVAPGSGEGLASLSMIQNSDSQAMMTQDAAAAAEAGAGGAVVTEEEHHDDGVSILGSIAIMTSTQAPQ